VTIPFTDGWDVNEKQVAVLENIRYARAQLGAGFKSSVLKIISTVNFNGATVVGFDFSYVVFKGLNCIGSKWINCNFTGASAITSNFAGSKHIGCTMFGLFADVNEMDESAQLEILSVVADEMKVPISELHKTLAGLNEGAYYARAAARNHINKHLATYRKLGAVIELLS
jgi:hypothetical protein